MEEIKIDDYVRTAHGKIDKVTEIIPGKFHTKYYGKEIAKGLNETIGTETDIVKHSKNIIDLIEIGDIVGLIDKDNKIHYYEVYDNTAMYQYQIKSIVTKEMMKSVEYRVETD